MRKLGGFEKQTSYQKYEIRFDELSIMDYKYINSCPNCKSTHFNTFMAEVIPNEIHSIFVKCVECNLIFANPVATDKVLEEYYKRQYYLKPSSTKCDIAYEREKKKKSITERIIQKYLKKTMVVLEIGSGWGSFIKKLQNQGVQTYGIEANEKAVNFCKNELKLNNVYCGVFDTHNFKNQKFDLIYSWHVIEHVSELNHFISKCKSLLNNNGIFIIGTENCASLRVKLLRTISFISQRVPKITTSQEHTYYFSKKTLRNILIKRGFQIIEQKCYAKVKNSANIKTFLKNIISLFEIFFSMGTLQYIVAQIKKNNEEFRELNQSIK